MSSCDYHYFNADADTVGGGVKSGQMRTRGGGGSEKYNILRTSFIIMNGPLRASVLSLFCFPFSIIIGGPGSPSFPHPCKI